MKLVLETWFERDRAHVELIDEDTDKTIIEWWDEDVEQAIEDGFLNPRDYFNSAVEYALSVGLLKKEDLEDNENDEDDENDED